jgi:hypothetical protein
MSIPLPPDDPAQILLQDDFTSTPCVNDDDCYICQDPEFAQMGLPLCRKCKECEKAGRGDGHVPADDTICTICGADEMDSDEFKEWCEKQGKI